MQTPIEAPIRFQINQTPRPSIFSRYRSFFLSKETLIALFNGVFLLAGLLFSITGQPQIGKWLYFVSAVVGSIPLFILTGKALFIRHDITAGFMASVAMIAAILVGEYSAAALVVFMFAIGDWLENLTVARADNALRDLVKLIPNTVVVIRDGSEFTIPIEQVNLGDRVLVRSGERFGVDGQVIAGNGSVNQSAITGESMPVEIKPGDDAFAGTLNMVGLLEITVSRLGQDTTLGQIIKLVKEAQKTQAPVQRLANRTARILVPITFAIALLVYLLTGDILRSITVLVVVCPCALVLATPTALVAAIGNAAKNGILVKSGAVIEQIGKVDVVAFDKTGTLTHGRPAVQTVIPLNGYDSDQILALAGAVEYGSEHPIGRSIVQASLERELKLTPVSDFTILPGYGITAQVGPQQVVIGTLHLLSERGILRTQVQDEQIHEMEDRGLTVIPIAVDGALSGLIALADTPRAEASPMVTELKRIGIREVIMITGDNPRTANRIASELGIDRVFAEVLPQDKLRIIRELQAGGKKVAYAGDGVNDAPALAIADIGIAMGLSGTDLALETADIGLMTDEIERIPEIIALSRRALQIILQNVVFSMTVNVLSVFLGGMGIIGPAFGALVHETSALPVLANSARLINYRQNMVKLK